MGQVKFYKSGNVWLYNEGIDSSVDKTVPPGNYRKSVINTTISIRGKESTFSLFTPDYIEVTDIQKSGTPDDNYASIAEFNLATDSFFSGQSTSLTDSNGKSIDVQNPLPSDGDSVYCKDLDLINSDIGDFSGEICTLFDDYTSANIAASVGGGGVNPKSLTLIFKRPIASSTVGIGSPDISISNSKLILIGLSGDPVKIIDLSADDTKKSVEIFQFEQKIFIGAQILFYTDDQVILGGAGITKTQFVAIDAINGVISNDNSTKELLLADAIFTGNPIDTKNYGIIICSVYSDVVSATDGLIIEFSTDQINWFWNDTYTIEEARGKTFSVQTQARYLRVRYINGSSGQSVFDLETTLKPVYIKPSSHRISDTISGEDDAELVKSVLAAFFDGGGFGNIAATKNGNLKVANVEELFSIAKGLVIGHSLVHKFGKHEDIPSSFVPLSIGGIYQTPQVSGATTLRVKAGNINDSSTGSGAREVTLIGLDETGAEVTETLATNGTSPGAAGTITWLRVPRGYVSKTGTYASAAADSHAAEIVIENSAGTADWLTIHKPDIGRGQSQIGVYTVPLGKTAYVFSYLLTTDSNKAVDFLFFQRESILDTTAPYQARRAIVEEIGIQGYLPGSFEGGQSFQELTDIGWMVKAAASAQATVDFEIALVDN